jgi:predicted flap endonuclease-1-like 5' DNA nuclease
MQWLIANMWMVLAVATFLGLLFGFSFRGLLASNQVRRAGVEREIAKTELTQAKAEVDALYAAQRKRKEEAAQAVGGDASLRQELDERETRITSLGDQLAAARSELEALKSNNDSDNGQDNGQDNGLVKTAAGAAVGAIAGAALSDDHEKELADLRDRNTWLEERVVALEADVSAAAAIVPAASEEKPEGDPALEKLNWQNAYLRQRVDALEAKTIALNEDVQSAAVVEVAEPQAEPDPAPENPEADNDPAANAAADEEMARLRWRNRYLEGRLAYFEQAEEAVEDVTEETTEEPEPVEPEADPVALAPVPDVAPEGEAPAAEASEEIHPSDAVLAELEGTQPEQVEKPSNGGDDLTAISGVGPRIAEVLNELGIWTYQQIAAWLPEHETWIENHLSFKGRVSRENWVGQAKELLVTA